MSEFAGGLGGDAPVDPQPEPALPAGGAVAQAEAGNAARQAAHDESLHFCVGKELAWFQRVDRGLGDFALHETRTVKTSDGLHAHTMHTCGKKHKASRRNSLQRKETQQLIESEIFYRDDKAKSMKMRIN